LFLDDDGLGRNGCCRACAVWRLRAIGLVIDLRSFIIRELLPTSSGPSPLHDPPRNPTSRQCAGDALSRTLCPSWGIRDSALGAVHDDSICARNGPDGTFSQRPANSRPVSTNDFKPRFVQNGLPIETKLPSRTLRTLIRDLGGRHLWLGSRHRLWQESKHAKPPLTSHRSIPTHPHHKVHP
jgi:hypothetical protein